MSQSLLSFDNIVFVSTIWAIQCVSFFSLYLHSFENVVKTNSYEDAFWLVKMIKMSLP